jgi:hypothetical protein
MGAMLNSPEKNSSNAQFIMKKLILTLAATAVALPLQAQLFSGHTVGMTALGGLIGGIVGHNSGRHTAEGIGIGAGAGLLLGALTDPVRTVPAVEAAPVEYVPVYGPPRPNYAVGGAVLGGIAGGIIGHNSGRHTAEGVAIGAASGLLLGGVAEHHARRHVQVVQGVPVATTYVAPTRAQVSGAAPAQSSPTQSVQNYSPVSSSPMAGANSLFGR